MHLNAQRPIFVPEHYQAEIKKMSKAALMDLMWDLAVLVANGEEHQDHKTMETVREHRDIVLSHRKQARKGPVW